MGTSGDTPTDDMQRFWAAVARAPCLHADHLRPAFALAGGPLALWRESVARLRALGLPPAASALLAMPPEAELDADLAFAAGERLRDALERDGAEVAWLPFEGGHGIPLVVWREFRRFILQRLGSEA